MHVHKHVHVRTGDKYHESFVSANETFLESVIPHIKEDDVVWVHDYHLMLLPKLLRDAGLKISIVFYLHLPFPTSQVCLLLSVCLSVRISVWTSVCVFVSLSLSTIFSLSISHRHTYTYIYLCRYSALSLPRQSFCRCVIENHMDARNYATLLLHGNCYVALKRSKSSHYATRDNTPPCSVLIYDASYCNAVNTHMYRSAALQSTYSCSTLLYYMLPLLRHQFWLSLMSCTTLCFIFLPSMSSLSYLKLSPLPFL